MVAVVSQTHRSRPPLRKAPPSVFIVIALLWLLMFGSAWTAASHSYSVADRVIAGVIAAAAFGGYLLAPRLRSNRTRHALQILFAVVVVHRAIRLVARPLGVVSIAFSLLAIALLASGSSREYFNADPEQGSRS